MAIEDLTHEVTGLQEGGVLQLSETSRATILGAITTFRGEITEARRKINGFQSIFYPGDYESAHALKRELTLNIFEILDFLDKYIGYLDECEATVEATCKLMQAEG
jgi:hypothetical protein